MTKNEMDTYKWLDAQEVRSKQNKSPDVAKQEKLFAQKMLDFLNS